MPEQLLDCADHEHDHDVDHRDEHDGHDRLDDRDDDDAPRMHERAVPHRWGEGERRMYGSDDSDPRAVQVRPRRRADRAGHDGRFQAEALAEDEEESQGGEGERHSGDEGQETKALGGVRRGAR